MFTMKNIWILYASFMFLPQAAIGDNQPEQQCGGLPKLNLLPGSGWDILRSLNKGQVTAVTYDICNMTPDDKYRLPDKFFVIPLEQSNLNLFLDSVSSMVNYSSATTKSIVDVTGAESLGFGNSFSTDYQAMKKRLFEENAVAFRTDTRFTVYSIGCELTDALDQEFSDRVLTAVRAIEDNDTIQANSLLETLIRLYGTHIITRVDTGAIVMKEDFVRRDSLAEFPGSISELRAVTSRSFFKRFNFDPGHVPLANDFLLKAYEDSISSSEVYNFGGFQVQNNVSMEGWFESVPSNLAIIDRRGSQLHYAINSGSFPTVPAPLLESLRHLVKGIISKYYAYNEHRGCMNMESKTFDYNANVDENRCTENMQFYAFGGVYQTCQGQLCEAMKLTVANPITNDYRCHDKHVPVVLRSGKIRQRKCCHVCGDGWLVSSCEPRCRLIETVYTTFWCTQAEQEQIEEVAYFGGVYSTVVPNPVTKAWSCPPSFMNIVILEQLHVCIGTDQEYGLKHGVSFGGFFSCQYGNPLSISFSNNSLSKDCRLSLLYNRNQSLCNVQMLNSTGNASMSACPIGYTQHVAVEHFDCLIRYCIMGGTYNQNVGNSVIAPPFTRREDDVDTEFSPTKSPLYQNASKNECNTTVTHIPTGDIHNNTIDQPE